MDSFDLATDRVASIARGHQVDRTSLSLSLSRVFIEKKKKGRIRNRRASLWRLIFVGWLIFIEKSPRKTSRFGRRRWRRGGRWGTRKRNASENQKKRKERKGRKKERKKETGPQSRWDTRTCRRVVSYQRRRRNKSKKNVNKNQTKKKKELKKKDRRNQTGSSWTASAKKKFKNVRNNFIQLDGPKKWKSPPASVS